MHFAASYTGPWLVRCPIGNDGGSRSVARSARDRREDSRSLPMRAAPLETRTGKHTSWPERLCSRRNPKATSWRQCSSSTLSSLPVQISVTDGLPLTRWFRVSLQVCSRIMTLSQSDHMQIYSNFIQPFPAVLCQMHWRATRRLVSSIYKCDTRFPLLACWLPMQLPAMSRRWTTACITQWRPRMPMVSSRR
jgi:hypothetical protein